MPRSFESIAGDDPNTPRARALDALATQGAMSRAQLARAIGLAPSTVTPLVRSLVDERVLIEAELAQQPRERRPGPRGVGLALNSTLVTVIGVDFGFRHVRAIVCDLHAKVLAISQETLPTNYNKSQGLSAAAAAVRRALDDSGVDPLTVVGAGVGFPGPIDTGRQQVVSSDIQPGWGNTDAGEFAEALGVPVVLENDANLAALGEHVWGAGRGSSTTVTIKFHSGIGVGVIVHDELLSGTHGGAGELGHATVDPRGQLCRCGKRGCLDTFASVPAILAAMAGKHPDLELSVLMNLLEAEDPGAQRVVGDAAALVGQVIGSAALLLAPDKVIVVGAMSRAGDSVMTPLREAFYEHAIPGLKAPEVVRGVLGDQHTALGAVGLVLRHEGWLRPEFDPIAVDGPNDTTAKWAHESIAVDG